MAGADTPSPTRDKILMSIGTSCHFSHLLQIWKRNLFEVLILYTFFHDFIHVYSLGTGVDNPLGTKFWCQQEHLVTSGIRPVWSESSLSMKKSWDLGYPVSGQRRLIRLGGCRGWSESSLGAQVILLVLSCSGRFDIEILQLIYTILKGGFWPWPLNLAGGTLFFLLMFV